MDASPAAVGPYRIVRRLGAGGMGEVFLAEDPRLGRHVALKAVAARHATEPEARQRLLREARAAATLNHTGIAAIYDVLETATDTFIVMEYVEGTSLDEIVRRGPLPVRRVLQIGLELAEALAAAHAQGVVHRDLKPSNIRLTTGGRVKVLDFGLARTIQPEARVRSSDAPTALTEANQCVGTPGYMAPEQLRGSRGDQATDIYALGIVLFEMLTGVRPFEAPTMIELAVQVLTQPVPDVRAARPEVPADLAAIVARATAPEASQRITSMQELHDLLRDVYAEQPTPTPTPPLSPALPSGVALPSPTATQPPGARVREPMSVWARLQDRRVARVLAACVALALISVVGWRLHETPARSMPPPRASVVAVLPVTAPVGLSDLESFASGIGEILSANLATMPGLQVLSRRETTAALGAGRDVVRLLRDLAPNYIVSAAVEGEPSRFRLRVSLLDAAGTASWSKEYDAGSADPFELPALVSADLGGAMAAAGAVSARTLEASRRRFQQAPTPDREAWSHYVDALLFLDRPDIKGNVSRATTLLEEAVRKDPRFALAWAALGTAFSVQYVETRDERWPPRVLQANLEALRLDPDRAETRLALGQMYQNTGASDRAIDEFKRAMALSPASDTPRRLLGGLYTDLGQYDHAVAVLKEAIDLRPGYWRNWSFLGYAYFKAGRHGDAILAYERLLALQPDSARGHTALGTVLHESGRIDEARQHYQQALELEANASAWSNLGTLDYFDGHHADAVRAYQQAIQLRPKEASLHRNLGDALRALGRPSEATQAYETALALLEKQLVVNPHDGEALSMRSLVEARLGRLADAREHAAQALAALPDDKEVLYRSATVAALDGRADEAVTLLVRALDRGYSVAFATKDPDLEPVRRMPAVRGRLGQVGTPR